MKRHLILLPGVCLLLTLGIPARGNWQRFEAGEGGLADNRVFSILETTDGVLWFGTADGLNRYDGFRWQVFREELPIGRINAIAEGPDGEIWIGTHTGGAARYDGSTWEIFNTDTGTLPGKNVQALIVDRTGDAWFGIPPEGLARYERATSTWSLYTEADGSLINRSVSTLLEDQTGNLWVGTAAGVSRLDPTRTAWTDYPRDPAGLAGDSLLVIREDADGGVWFGTDQGAFRLHDGVWEQFTASTAGLPGNVVTTMVADERGGMWFGGLNGLSHFDGRSWRAWDRTDDATFLRRILALELDRSGNLWVGTLQGTLGRLFRFDQVDWVDVPILDMTDLLEDSAGEIWITTGINGVYRFDLRGRWTKPVGLPLAARTVYEDPQQNLWFGLVGSGLMRLGADRSTTEVFGAGSLPGLTVDHVFQDSRGVLWVSTDQGLASRSGATWTSWLDGNGPNPVSAVYEGMEDGEGSLWFRTSTGLYRVGDLGGAPVRVDATTGIDAGSVTALYLDSRGARWFGTDQGLSRLDSGSWTEFPSLVDPSDVVVNAIGEGPDGAVWVGSLRGATRFDGAGRESFGFTALGTENVTGVLADDQGTVWLSASFNGLVRRRETAWRAYDTGDGLASNEVTHMLQDRRGNLWFAGFEGIVEHRPDRTAPQTIFLTTPSAVTGNREANFFFGSAYGDAADIEYRVRVDGMDRTGWTTEVTWTELGLPDGLHTVEVEGRDWSGNLDPTPAAFTFEVDATPPTAVISSPAFGDAVRGDVDLEGTAADPRFTGYSFRLRPQGGATWSTIFASGSPVVDGRFAIWDSRTTADGYYDLELVVDDNLGLSERYPITILVDNREPFAEVTAPLVISSRAGGDAFSVPGYVHLYFSPRAFPRDVEVRIDDVPPLTPADRLGGGPDSVLVAAALSWGGETLQRPAALDMRPPEPYAGALSIYRRGVGGSWTELGGTPKNGAVSLSVTEPGTYVLGTPTGTGIDPTLRPLVLTPRIFSPTGGSIATEVAISFSLEAPGPVQVKVFNRAGRLIRRVLDTDLGAGANLVRWNGRNDGGEVVPDGIYIVAVRADGKLQQKTLSVVR